MRVKPKAPMYRTRLVVYPFNCLRCLQPGWVDVSHGSTRGEIRKYSHAAGQRCVATLTNKMHRSKSVIRQLIDRNCRTFDMLSRHALGGDFIAPPDCIIDL